MEYTVVIAGALLWSGLAVMAIASTLLALVVKARKRAVATFALCLWCAVAGGTLTSALWSWMTLANSTYQRIQIARIPPNSDPNEVELRYMAMLLFYVKLDLLGRRLLYLTVLVPLVFSIAYFRRARDVPGGKKPWRTPEDELGGGGGFVAEVSSDFERRRESETARLAATGRVDADTVRELLIWSCHSSPIANLFFESRLGSEELLGVLLGLAVEDDSGDAQMTASYWVSRFPPGMLASHVPELEAVAANEWDSVSHHAHKALAAVRGELSGA